MLFESVVLGSVRCFRDDAFSFAIINRVPFFRASSAAELQVGRSWMLQSYVVPICCVLSCSVPRICEKALVLKQPPDANVGSVFEWPCYRSMFALWFAEDYASDHSTFITNLGRLPCLSRCQALPVSLLCHALAALCCLPLSMAPLGAQAFRFYSPRDFLWAP